MRSKFVRLDDAVMWEPQQYPLEVETDNYSRADDRVIVGLGVGITDGNLSTLRVAYRLLDPESGLSDALQFVSAGPEPDIEPRRSLHPGQEIGDTQILLCGFGARANPGNLVTLWVWFRDILDDGTLSTPVEKRYGLDKHHEPQLMVMVPNAGVIVGVGMRAKPGNITHLGVWYGRLTLRSA